MNAVSIKPRYIVGESDTGITIVGGFVGCQAPDPPLLVESSSAAGDGLSVGTGLGTLDIVGTLDIGLELGTALGCANGTDVGCALGVADAWTVGVPLGCVDG